MSGRKSFASLLMFVGSLLCFSLPFVTVSCGDSVTLTGKDLVGGVVIQHRRIATDPWAAFAATSAIVGIGLSIVGRNMAKGATAAGAVGSASLLLMKSNIETQVRQQSGGMGMVTMETGFFLTMLLLAFAAIWNGIMIVIHEDH